MKIGKSIISTLIKDRDVISATIVGSYSEIKNINQIGDLDVVVICKKLNKIIFDRLNKKIKTKYPLVNTSFGPLKIGSKKKLPVHLMIYDIDTHKEHVIKSPFTCYDWQRSKMFKGIPLKDIFPVRSLQLDDFFNSRRSSQEYLRDIKKNKISIRKYYFKGKKILINKKYIKIDPRNRGEFVYHVINFLVINLFKFYNNKNLKITGIKFDEFFLKITNNDLKLLNKFKIIKRNKIKKTFNYNLNTITIALEFIKKYDDFLKKIKKEYIELSFVRHAKTSMNKKNIFLGIKNDPNIIDVKKKKINRIRYDYIITSDLKRAKQSSKLFFSKKILHNKLINEIDYGNVDGMSYEILKKKYPNIIKSWKNKIDIKFPNGENLNDVKKRVKKFLNYLRKFKKGSKILIISHSFFLRVFISLILNTNLKMAHKINIDHLIVFQFLKKGNFLFPNFNRLKIEKIYRDIYG